MMEDGENKDIILTFYVKREDTGKLERIKIKETLEVFDLLKKSREDLKYDPDIGLELYKENS